MDAERVLDFSGRAALARRNMQQCWSFDERFLKFSTIIIEQRDKVEY